MTSAKSVRYNWIDWSKSIAIFLVIWGHVPMQSETHTIIYSFHMPLFFLISGYLYNPKGTIKEELYKDLKTLLLPYLIYQFIFYPYWFVRELIVPHQVINIHNSIIQPLIQSLSSDPINGPTCYILPVYDKNIFLHYTKKQYNILVDGRYQQPSLHTHLLLAQPTLHLWYLCYT